MTKEQIHSLCKQYKITNYTINKDMSIDVNGDVDFWDKKLDKLPLRFRKVTGLFDCSHNKLTTLEGSPIEVGGDFDCSNNNLTSLKGCPIEVGDYFWCIGNKLISLENGPKFIVRHFYCYNNPIYEEFKTKFNKDYNLYVKYTKRQKVLKQLI